MLKFSKNTQKYQIKMQILTINNRNYQKLSNRTKVKILKTKFLDSSSKCSNIEILAKTEEKEAKYFSKIYKGHIRI
jgi:hypothetical protein